MKRIRQLVLWTTFAFFVSLLGYWSRTKPPSAQDRIDSVPNKGLTFKLTRIPWSRNELNTLQEAGGSKWHCQMAGDEIVLVVIDGAQNMHAIHDPAFCFRGAGFDVVRESDVPLSGGVGRQVELKSENEKRELVYWFSDTRTRYHSLLNFRLQTAFSRLNANQRTPLMILLYGRHRTPDQWASLVDVLPFMEHL